MTPPHFLVVCPHVNTRTIMKDLYLLLIGSTIMIALIAVLWILLPIAFS